MVNLVGFVYCIVIINNKNNATNLFSCLSLLKMHHLLDLINVSTFGYILSFKILLLKKKNFNLESVWLVVS